MSASKEGREASHSKSQSKAASIRASSKPSTDARATRHESGTARASGRRDQHASTAGASREASTRRETRAPRETRVERGTVAPQKVEPTTDDDVDEDRGQRNQSKIASKTGRRVSITSLTIECVNCRRTRNTCPQR